jgi:hypothetical protein
MQHKLETLKTKINSGQFPNDYPHFGGANLIITDDPDRRGYPQDVVICSEHASALSWLVFELKNIYNEEIDYMNKYEFYPYIGQLINKTLKRQEHLFETMLQVVEEIESDWGVK